MSVVDAVRRRESVRVDIDAPLAYLAERVAGALGAIPPAVGSTDVDTVDAQLGPTSTVWPTQTASAARRASKATSPALRA
ncbi:hypothetical protein DFH11DRAFT_1731294 [Phellopilus nigrolimitatus]|nr:hypothetical protein DFH11DRAFT_1731294 [Phellopilus nigrolimitatus]